ncbi:MAG: peptidoglycan-binding protein [Rhodobacteraceae bacterium]|jgi:Putative secretion activating protein|uniref:Peptidoglycan-binding protein n=1 Tax=Thioclava marina TaxID=1915077 RepID=A0ABX3MPM1_9RHOB|nr:MULTISPECIES: holin-associated N-acetylmuramidase [Thioclava]TNE88331.1 MAG: peptidoglycan-binding protein [Paracoccaceae bacterium]MBD3804297.1 peptidoglycan-binding protein [Thioclava sp.]OOY13498.1 peptidoglycan-binding protein [Thioclava marina]OOY29213.1 peptidoglycan-binding protein [Thioclava sp. L04-15]TNF10212.1 MAG: peptidoglycan-binding protein [Paracoccaceae bacterium]
MKTVTQIAAEIVAREGGYVDDPDDPGGATKHGVTLGTLRRLGRDLTGDGRIDEMDVRALDPAQASEIFIQHYYEAPRIDRLPAAIQPSVFDMYVNAGGNAVVILQRLLGDMGQRIIVDGIIGPQTVAAAEIADATAPGYFADAYGIARRNYYYRVADARPASRKFATTRAGQKGGWIRRAEEFISPRFHLTETEHRKRVSAWA